MSNDPKIKNGIKAIRNDKKKHFGLLGRILARIKGSTGQKSEIQLLEARVRQLEQDFYNLTEQIKNNRE